MTAIGPVAGPTAAASKATGRATLGQADFLRLLTTQLKSQDPLQPMDTQTMVSQMQSLSQTSGIAEMNAQLKAIAATLASQRIGDAASWIGRDALVPGDFAHQTSAGGYRGQLSLDAPADRVTIDLLDAQGLIVHSEAHDNVAAGALPFAWDGRGADGTATAGALRVRVMARSGDRAVPTTTAVWTPITAVQSPAGGADQRLVTPNGLVAPDAAIRLG